MRLRHRKAAGQQEGATMVMELGRKLWEKTGAHLHAGRDKPFFSLLLSGTQKALPSPHRQGCQTPPLHTPKAWQEGEGVGCKEVAAGSVLLTQHQEHVWRAAEGIPLCSQARDIPANSVQRLTTPLQALCLLSVQLSLFPWKPSKMNLIRSPPGLFSSPAHSK